MSSGVRIWHSPCWCPPGSWVLTSGHTGLWLPLRCVLCVRYTGAAVKWAGVFGAAVRMTAGNRWEFLRR